jgi:signal transduction histidine kinase
MSNTKLVVVGPKGTREVTVNAKGTTLGRESNCDIVLDCDTVSRLHARIYQDTFGRWIAEDLGSQNGVLIDGQRIKAQVVLPGQNISISPFSLSLAEEADPRTGTGSSVQSAIPIVDKGLEESIVTYRADQKTLLSPDLMQDLNELTGRLLKLSSPAELYSEACLLLAQMLDTLVVIVRLPCDSEPLPKSPDILACQFGRRMTDDAVFQMSNLNLSKRVLEAIRSADTPVMARSGPSSDKHMVLTIVDESSPHLVFCARVNDQGDSVDALYVDVLEDKSPEAMFDFVEAIARQVNFVQKNLFFIELQKQQEALREANLKLQEKDRIKDEYVSRVTHDIKGHLAAIQSCLFVASDKSCGPLSERQADFLGRAVRRTGQLTDFVKELLNLTRMRLSGRMEMDVFSLPDCISKALGSVAGRAEEKSITLTSKVDSSVGEILGNQFSINEMITNLLFNAVKYTPEGKSVSLEAGTVDDSIRIDIADTGIGIPADEVASVFEEFFRATNARNSDKEGTGLGLSIVKQIVERHGGGISVKSEQDQGTTFTVVLPRNTG